MSWTSHLKPALAAGKTVTCRPRGDSMKGKIESGSLVTIAPITAPPEVGDIVLVTVRGQDYVHLIKAIDGDRFLIGNNRGGINGWTSRRQLHGIVTKVGD